MNILLLRTWLTNIGNGFIDEGAKAAIEEAVPGAQVIDASGYSYYAAWIESFTLRREIRQILRGKTVENALTGPRMNAVSVAQLVKVDVAVLAGCVLEEQALSVYMNTLTALRDRGVPLVLLGAGGLDYRTATREHVTEALKSIQPAALLTRDRSAYQAYGSLVNCAYDGIDCGFFVDKYYRPPPSTERFVVATFDEDKEPTIEADCKVIHITNHPFEYAKVRNPGFNALAGLNALRRMKRQLVSPRVSRRLDGHGIFTQTSNAFVSDAVKDYLFFYGNAAETHSDKIHACVPTLTYGNQAKFYYQTARAGLFDRIQHCLSGDIRAELVRVDLKGLSEEKKGQVAALRQAIERSVGLPPKGSLASTTD